ncbi:MAG: SDR family oxidoreductase [Steroidobacteraceae bacterium]
MDLGIAGKVAFVMGGSQGIGRAVAFELAQAGCKIAVVARTQQPIDEVVQRIRAASGMAIGVRADMSVLANVDAAVARVTQELGAPDIAIFNPPTPLSGAFFERTEEDFAASYNDLVLCFARLVRRVTPHMKDRRWGRIVTIGAACAKQPMRGQLNFAYALGNTNRLAAVSLCKTIAAEVAPFGITVNTIATGAIDTDMARGFFANRARDAGLTEAAFMTAMGNQIPVGRVGTPEEMAALCAFLCSARAGYTTGELILCDGGVSNTPL